MTDIHPLEKFPDSYSPTVYLTDREYEKCRELGKQIQRKFSSYNEFPSDSKEQSDRYSETGIMGEVAVAKYYGLSYPDFISDGGDGGYDFYVRNENSGEEGALDVKTRDYSDGDLLIDPGRYVADAFILVERRIQNFKLVGVINASEVSGYKQRGDRFPGNPYYIPRKDLKPVPKPSDFVEIFPKKKPTSKEI